MKPLNDPTSLAGTVLASLFLLACLTFLIRRAPADVLARLKRQITVGTIGTVTLFVGVGLTSGLWFFSVALPWLLIRQSLSVFGGAVFLYQLALLCSIRWSLRNTPAHSKRKHNDEPTKR